MSRALQIISFTIPWPADYGGVIDIYYRLLALKDAGIEIDLHCFEYNRKPAELLKKICRNVFYYPRSGYFDAPFSGLPYIIRSRNHIDLEKRIRTSGAPVLMEGLHSTSLLQDVMIAERSFVRIHNIEHEYYSKLSKAESSLFRKIYLKREAARLAHYEPVLNKAAGLACISSSETNYYSGKFGGKAFHLPAFHPYSSADVPGGKGEYVLYHGNLAIAENHKAALFLLRSVCVQPDFPLIIAGRSPRKSLLKEAAKHSNVKIIADPGESEMEQLIRDAHVHALPTFQETGVKLKLLAALFRGRFVVTNSAMTSGTGLETLCERADSGHEFHTVIRQLMEKEVSQDMQQKRNAILSDKYNNNRNAQILIQRTGI